MPWTSSGSPTISPAVMRGLSEENGSWKMICACLRNGRSSFFESPLMSWPCIFTTPDVGSISRRMARPAVDFIDLAHGAAQQALLHREVLLEVFHLKNGHLEDGCALNHGNSSRPPSGPAF